jgi:hypothetical protein
MPLPLAVALLSLGLALGLALALADALGEALALGLDAPSLLPLAPQAVKAKEATSMIPVNSFVVFFMFILSLRSDGIIIDMLNADSITAE